MAKEIIIVIVLAVLALVLVGWLLIRLPELKRIPANEVCCGNCRYRYPMSQEDLEHFPCKSKHRCSIDGMVIPDMETSWCPSFDKDNGKKEI